MHFDIALTSILKKQGKEYVSERRFNEEGIVTYEQKEQGLEQIDDNVINGILAKEYSANIEDILKIIFKRCKITDIEVQKTIGNNIIDELMSGIYVYRLDKKHQNITMQLNKFELLQRKYQIEKNENAEEKLKSYVNGNDLESEDEGKDKLWKELAKKRIANSSNRDTYQVE